MAPCGKSGGKIYALSDDRLLRDMSRSMIMD